jgi:hypothetical protein
VEESWDREACCSVVMSMLRAEGERGPVDYER